VSDLSGTVSLSNHWSWPQESKITVQKETTSPIIGRLLAWYDRQKRDLPWRMTRDPYHIWVSEIMLQQTQVDTVIPYYHHFLKEFPSVEALARADLHDVLMVWENLGYYGRARNLHKAARIISHEFGGAMPDTWDDLIDLPGIGPYTAGAILSIAFGKRYPAVDGNARRVLSRLFAVDDPVNRPETQRTLYELAEGLTPFDFPGIFCQALMDLGSLICMPGNPLCYDCPVCNHCRAFEMNVQHRLPVISKKNKIPHKDAVAAILCDSRNRVLVVRRPAGGLLGSLWRFPGGFPHEGEPLPDGLRRIVLEELGLKINVHDDVISSVKHAYTHFSMTLHIYRCTHNGAEPDLSLCRDWQWIAPEDFKKLPFSRAERKVIAAVFHDDGS
jgi:A/G-specific adenine glycosylase